MEEQKLNNKEFTPEHEVVQLMTEKQKEALQKFRSEGTTNFSRNDYKHLNSIKKTCRDVLENYDEALKLYLELTG